MTNRLDLSASAGIASDGKPAESPPRSEVIVGGPIAGKAARGIIASRNVDEVVRRFGRRVVWDLMGYDSAVACAFELLKAGIISDGMRLSPALKIDPGEIVSKRKRKREIKESDEICDAAIRATATLDEPIETVCDDMLSAFQYGCSLTEQTYRWGAGLDRDRLVFASLVVKPDWAWAFEVNRYFGIEAIRCWTGEAWESYSPDKFAVLTWGKKYRDPRGNSGFRPAYNPWNLKAQKYPEFGEFLSHFADPIIWLTAGANAKADNYKDEATGKVMSRSVMAQVQDALAAIKHRTGLALPNGSQAGVLGPGTEGGAYHQGFDRFDMEIFRAIVGSARPLQEAKHGSKADSGEGANLVMMRIQQGRLPLQRCLRDQVYRRWTRENYGEEAASRKTPLVTFGTPGDAAGELLNAYANAYAKGFLDDAQLPAVWDKLGLPPVDEAAMKARIEDRKRRGTQPQKGSQDGQDNGGGGSGDGGDPNADGNGP